jgi:hypothetical protein
LNSSAKDGCPHAERSNAERSNAERSIAER